MSDISDISREITSLPMAPDSPELNRMAEATIRFYARDETDASMLLEACGLRPYVSGERVRSSQTVQGRAKYYQRRKEASSAAAAARAAARDCLPGGDDPAQGRLEVPGRSTPAGTRRVGDPRGVPLARA